MNTGIWNLLERWCKNLQYIKNYLILIYLQDVFQNHKFYYFMMLN